MTEDITREMRIVYNMPYGAARTAAAEALARRIEAEGPQEKLPEALLDLVEAYNFSDEGLKSFVVFARLLRLWDASPELFTEWDHNALFWDFKWVAADLTVYPEITREQAEAFLVDMERRFDLAGHGKSSIALSRFTWAWRTGSADMEQARLDWASTPRDRFDDCAACIIGRQVEYFTDQGRWQEAVTLGKQQNDTCNREPFRTYHSLALAALMVGDAELAAHTYQLARGTLAVISDPYCAERGQGFEVLARGGQLERALRELRNEYLQLLTQGSTPLQHLRFLLGVLAGLSCASDAPETATGLRRKDWATIGSLHTWVLNEAQTLAAKFDQRNGNSFYADHITRACAATRSDTQLVFATTLGLPVLDEAESGADTTSALRDPELSHDPTAAAQHDPTPADTLHTALTEAGETAETLVRSREHRKAVPHYLTAAGIAEKLGLLGEAALAYAEAAQNAAIIDDTPAAHSYFAAAYPRAVAAQSDASVLVQILSAWAPIAAHMNVSEIIISHGETLLSQYHTFDGSQLSEELAERKQREWLSQRAALRDLLARSLDAITDPSSGAEAGLKRAESLAASAAEDFAQLGLLSDAAHAFWLCGRIQRTLGDSSGALWSLESAAEGFSLASDREHSLEVSGEFITLLRETGQEDRAQTVIAKLSEL